MKGAREFLTIWAGLIAAYLVLEHYTGFSADVNAISKGGSTITRDLQGR